MSSQSSNFSQNFSGYLDVCGSVGMEVAFTHSLSVAQLLSHNHGDRRGILSLSSSLSLCVPLATVNSPSLHEMLLLCLRGCGIAQGSSTGLQHCHHNFTAPFFTRAEINEESEHCACYKNERNGKRFPSHSHSKAGRQRVSECLGETVLQVSSENKVGYMS